MKLNNTGLAMRPMALMVLLVTMALPAGAQNRNSSGLDVKPAAGDSTITNLERADALARVFEMPGLAVGDLFPAVDIFDEEGEPFNTGKLREHYTVLVNGCLT